MVRRFSNARIVGEHQILEGQYVYVKDSVIVAVTQEELPFDEDVDVAGKYLSPGFIDLHVHGGADCDFMDGNEEAVVKAANFHYQNGTTTICPTTLSASYEQTAAALEAIQRAVDSGKILPNVAGVHMEGPYFALSRCGAQNKTYITPPVPEDYNRILKKYGNLVKRWSFAPELPGTKEFVETLNENNVLTSIGHSDATYDDVMAVYEQGCRSVTHFYNCISTITKEKGYRILGITECGYLIKDMMLEVIADGCHVPKELFRMLYQIKGSDTLCLVTDAMRCAGTKEEISHIGGVPCKIKNGVACLLDESAFAGSVATADRLIRFCVKDVGIDLCEAVKMMTLNPAKVLGLERKGKIAVGYDADLVIFDENIHVEGVFNGRNHSN